MYNIDPKIWGQVGWDFLFYIALSYPDNPSLEEQNNMKNFLINMGKVLPCEKCRFNFSEHLKKYPINNLTLQNRNNLTNWLINVLNEIRVQNGKRKMTYEEIVNKYIKNKNTPINFHLLYISSLIIIIIALIIFIKFKY